MDGHLGRLKKTKKFVATAIKGINCVKQGVVMWGYKVVVPSALKSVAGSYVVV